MVPIAIMVSVGASLGRQVGLSWFGMAIGIGFVYSVAQQRSARRNLASEVRRLQARNAGAPIR